MAIRAGKVDIGATEALRARAPAGSGSHFDYGPERDAFERRLPPKSYDQLVDLLQTVPVSWRFFLKQRVFHKLPELDARDPDAIVSVFNALEADYPQLQ